MSLVASPALTVSAAPLPTVFRGKPTAPLWPLAWPAAAVGDLLTYAVDLSLRQSGPQLVNVDARVDPASGLTIVASGYLGTLALVLVTSSLPGTWTVAVTGILSDGERRTVSVSLPVIAIAVPAATVAAANDLTINGVLLTVGGVSISFG